MGGIASFLSGCTTSLVQAQLSSNPQLHSPNCEYHTESASVGIYHFRFSEANKKDLVKVYGHKVHKLVAEPLKKMIRAARSQGIDLKIASAFRSINHQEGIIKRKKEDGTSLKQIYFFSAPSGFSEHHTGLAIDFYPVNSKFEYSATYRWLTQNADKYGFVQTFTESNANKTGVSVESWHWKYIGHPQARELLMNMGCYT
ncbi:M15 family metallopeptidase [Ursidibacter arcticus]